MTKAFAEYDYSFEWNRMLTKEMKTSFAENGFFIAKGFLDNEEVTQLTRLISPEGILKHSFTSHEYNGTRTVKTLCAHPGTDVSGMVARSEKVVNTCDQLLHTEVYHWCSMFVLKEARFGAKHEWHQDYGFWYDDGCLFPDMATVWVPLDHCDSENSCIQVYVGSHKLGRMNHVRTADGQLAAEDKRIVEVQKHFRHVFLEMDAGDAFIHHGNLLHYSGENRSDRKRWAFMSCYNTAYNTPFEKTGYPEYVKLDKVPDSAIKDCTNYTDFSGKGFFYHE